MSTTKGRFGLLSVLCLFLLAPLAQSVMADTPPPRSSFRATVFNKDTREIMDVDQNGTVLDQDILPALAQSNQPINGAIDVSDSGQYVAYVLGGGNSPDLNLVIYDRVNNRMVDTFTIAVQPGEEAYHSLSFDVEGSNFGANEQLFAFGFSVEDTWQVVVIDLQSNSPNVLSRLDSSVASVPQSLKGRWQLPVPRQFDGQYVDFMIIPVRAGSPVENPAFRWNTLNPDYNSNVSENPAFRTTGSDYLTGVGEVIQAVHDDRLPFQQFSNIMGGSRPTQTLQVATSPNSSTFPVYSQSDAILSSPRFIQNGERVAVRRTMPQPNRTLEEWLVVNRNGGVANTLGIGDLRPTGMESVPDGFVYTGSVDAVSQATGYTASSNPTASVLMYVQTTRPFGTNSGLALWVSNANQSYQVVWAGSKTPRNSLPSWTRDLANTVQSQGTASLSIGSQARINTTEGDQANVRSGPGLNFSVVDRLNDGDTVDLLEGPADADGFSWWRVRTPNGQTGWIVQATNNVQVLMPLSGSGTTGNPPTSPPSTASNLRVGGVAEVTANGDNLNARLNPTTNASVVSVLQVDQTFRVLDGPVQADGYTWWRLDTTQGAAWAADGTARERWLRPAMGAPATQPPVVPPSVTPQIDVTSLPRIQPTVTPTPTPSPARPPIIGQEDCLSYNAANYRIDEQNNTFTITDGSSRILSFGSNEGEAIQALNIIDYYGTNSQCFVGRPNPPFTYWLVNGQAPSSSYPSEDCIAFDPSSAQVTQSNGNWVIQSGRSLLFNFGANRNQAEKALSIIQHYDFRQSCYVGRPDPSMSYLRR